MKLGERLYYYQDGKMNLFSSYESVQNIYSLNKIIRKWYGKNPYPKRISKRWICSDYRIDQQRPQRNVYSEAYLEIVEITPMEEKMLSALIKSLESKIDYPTVWDDGKNRYYEETIYCPNCNKRRKVLTSKTHCEFCGFEFSKALKCEKCGGLNLKGSDECKFCGYDFRKKVLINDESEIKINLEKCPICNTVKSKNCDKCENCGYNFKGKKQCVRCKKWVDDGDKYCMYCGQMLKVLVECNNCGKKNNDSYKFCSECGVMIK